jgi:hypothetical protein
MNLIYLIIIQSSLIMHRMGDHAVSPGQNLADPVKSYL